MANLKETRLRITSVKSTQQITKAMKLVSATKLRRAQQAIVQMRPYADKLKEMLVNLASSVEDETIAKYFEQREVTKILVVVITSDRGLCGAFNGNVVKKVKSLVTEKYAHLTKDKITFLPIGKKGNDAFGNSGYAVIPNYIDTFTKLNAGVAFESGQFLLDAFTSQQFDKVYLVYNKFVNAATQSLTAEQLLPIDLASVQTHNKQVNDYLFEPSKIEILSDLIPRSLKTQFYRALLDSFASEHGARMVAMDKATDNAGELIKSLQLSYNQARQAAITTELSEIVGGAAALNG